MLFNTNRTREHSSSVLKLYSKNANSRYSYSNIMWKTTQPETDSLDSENIRENWIRTLAVVRNFTHRFDVVIDQE